jgi:SAM-dependent methyltransferase
MTSKGERGYLVELAGRRRVPSLTNPHYLVLRKRSHLMQEWLDQVPGDNLVVLDIGGRYQPYRPLLRNRVKRYVALDLQPTELVDVVASGDRLPFSAASFDVVLATAVFEFFPEPRLASQEIHRVLKPGGFLLMSVGAFCPRFVDGEHWRYMKTGLRWTLGHFDRVEIVPETFVLGGLCRTLNTGLYIVAKHSWVRWLLGASIIPMINLAGLALDELGLSQNDQMAGNYSALAQKQA